MNEYLNFEFVLESLGQNFSVDEYLEVIMKDYLDDNNEIPNLKDLITILEGHVRDLSFLKDANLNNIKRSREKCILLFDKWKNITGESLSKIEVLKESANSIDSEIYEINQKASVIVGKLLTIKSKQEKVIEAEKLLNYIMLFNDPSKVYSFYHDIFDDISQKERAQLLIQLNIICEESESDKLATAKFNIKKSIQDFEIELIQQFNNLIKDNKINSLKEIYNSMKILNKENSLIKEFLNHVKFRSCKDKNYEGLNQIMDDLNIIFADCLEMCKSYYFPIIVELFTSNHIKIFELVFEKCFESTIIPFIVKIFEKVEDDSIFLRICTHLLDLKLILEKELEKTKFKLRGTFINEQFEKIFTLCNNLGYKEKESINITNYFQDISNNRKILELNPDILTDCFNFINEVIKRSQYFCNHEDGYDVISDNILSFISKIFDVIIHPVFKATNHKLEIIQIKLQSIFRSTFNMDKLNNSFRDYMYTIQFLNSSVVLLQKWIHVDNKVFIENSTRGKLCLDHKRTLLQSLEDNIDESLHKFIDIQIMIIKKYFRKLRKKSKSKEVLNESLENSSKECQRICSFLRNISTLLSSSLDGGNLLIMLFSLVNRFIDSLLSHLSKYEVKKEVGSLIIVRDLSEYDKIIKEFFVQKIVEIQKNYINVISLESMNRRIDIILGISKLYLVHPNQLENVIHEYPCLEAISKSTIYKIISNRYDYDNSWTKKYKSIIEKM